MMTTMIMMTSMIPDSCFEFFWPRYIPLLPSTVVSYTKMHSIPNWIGKWCYYICLIRGLITSLVAYIAFYIGVVVPSSSRKSSWRLPSL